MSVSSQAIDIMPIYTGALIVEWQKKNSLESKSQFECSSDANNNIVDVVAEIIRTVSKDGDKGLQAIAQRLGDRPPRAIAVGKEEALKIESRMSASTIDVLKSAKENIERFGKGILETVKAVQLDFGEYQAGFALSPVRRVACYIPAGRYPLASTALMTAVTARVAGVEQVCIVSPKLNDEVIFAGTIAGVTEFYEIGGAQAIAALALGTETIPAVDMIVGPGNAYVTEAKRQLFGTVGIDMLAGPSEVAVIADGGANPEWAALDLLAQAEHDPSSRVYLLTDSNELAIAVQNKLAEQLCKTSFPDFVSDVLKQSAILVLNSLQECCRIADVIAPEHLELMVANPKVLQPLLKNYGALFVGYDACVPFGDYMAGPNHTLPTNKAARFAGGLSPLTFLRGQTWLAVSPNPKTLASKTASFANIEGLVGHELAASSRLRK